MSVDSAFCFARAAENASAAAATTLDNVRERCLRAETAWRALATTTLRSEEQRAAAAARKQEKIT